MRDKYLPLVRKIRNLKLFFFLSTLFLVLATVVIVKNLLVSFVIAFVIYFLLNPIVDYFERRGLSRLYATLIPFFGISLVLAIFTPILVPILAEQFDSLRTDYPKYVDGVSRIIKDLQTNYGSVLETFYQSNIALEVQAQVTALAQDAFKALPEQISNSLTILFLSPFLAFFMLLDGREVVRQLLALVPNNFFELACNLNYQIASQMGGFIRARMLESAIVGLVIWVGLILIDFPYGLVLAIVAGLLNLIPYVGPVIGAIPAFLIALINGASAADYLSLSLVYATAQIVDIVFVIPFVVAKIVDLHPVTVVLAVLIGAQFMGVLGMIISIPVASVFKVTFSALYRHLTEFRD